MPSIARDDNTRCHAVVEKYTDFARKSGTRSQYVRALEILLPSSPLYEHLEGRIPHPSWTFIKVAELTEQEEKENINFEIGQRRTRLGAKIDQVTFEVKREVLQKSKLGIIYQGVIDWTNDDEARRLFEEKLLQHTFETLGVLKETEKPEVQKCVESLAKGMVIIKHPFLLAWKTVLEWNEYGDLESLDVGLLQEFIEFFPDDGLSKVLRGFLDSEISPFPKVTVQEPEDGPRDDTTSTVEEERLLLMAEGLEDNSSPLASRIMADYYLYLEEFESAVETARKAQRQLQTQILESGLHLTENVVAIKNILATALVQYQAPRYHPEARSLFNDILQLKPTESSALIGMGLIFEEQEDHENAITFLERALTYSGDIKIKAEAAWCRALSGEFESGLFALNECLSELKGSDLRTRTLKSQILYRSGMCIWNLDSSKKARRDRKGAYDRFLSSIQINMNFAPAYTSLGIYYADYAKDKDRARKCFQKAFELSPSEVEASRRLAESFANTREWDLVEVVAQRVVDSGKIRPSPGSRKKGISWPFAALGVVQLNNQQYSKSIVSFQSAIRISPEDYHSWVGLGESYHNSGRYIAATKAFEQAQKIEAQFKTLNVEDTWFTKYMLANVKRELGQYDEAIGGYRAVLCLRLREYGVSMALLQCLVERAWHNVELGFFGRAIGSADEAIKTGLEIAEWRNGVPSLWKAIGDACSVYSSIQTYSAGFPSSNLRALLEKDLDTQEFQVLAKLDRTDQSALELLSEEHGSFSPPEICCVAAILAHKRALHCCANDRHARAVAWYNLGWAEYRASVCYGDKVHGRAKEPLLRFVRASVQCFKRSIEHEAGNSEFWNSLGIATSTLNPKVSQHSFVRSLYLNEKSAKVWTNLGTLYLAQKDHRLANDAFTRAQSADPEYAHAWLGQGLVASQLGESAEARNLFSHAFEITTASSKIIKEQYTSLAFDHLISMPTAEGNAISLLQPLFALQQLSTLSIDNAPFQHLTALFQERVGDYNEATTNFELASSKLESEFERSESLDVLVRFAQIKADLSRAQLAGKQYDPAIENAETAISLLDEQSFDSLSDRQGFEKADTHKIKLSTYITAGLAHFHRGSMDHSLNMFRSALEESASSPDIVSLLAQVLWAKGGAQERNVAREQLFNSVEKQPGNADIIMLLGAIAVLDSDLETIEAIRDDLQGLRVREDLSLQQRTQLVQLISIVTALYPGEQNKRTAQMSEAMRTVMLNPSQPHGWSQLAELTNNSHPAQMAVLSAMRAVAPHGNLDAEDLCKAYAAKISPDDSKEAIMLAPWMTHGWSSVAQVQGK
ncbi:MAG: hypothetical protein LQ351_003901 [Letrouitia transgressa]|nr:MAG: hypothetical protein LQ351_003901 [Letrouitia transgressa]